MNTRKVTKAQRAAIKVVVPFAWLCSRFENEERKPSLIRALADLLPLLERIYAEDGDKDMAAQLANWLSECEKDHQEAVALLGRRYPGVVAWDKDGQMYSLFDADDQVIATIDDQEMKPVIDAVLKKHYERSL
jgi:hypothetical protein